MAKVKTGDGAKTKRSQSNPKTTSIGMSKNTRFRNKNDKKNKKKYRGQGK